MDKINQLQGITFKMDKIEKRQMGFIAQDVKEIIPEVVQENNEGINFMCYDKLTALLAEGVKELSSEIKNLKAKNELMIQFIKSKFPGEFEIQEHSDIFM